ncbi:D-arabinono-1,4-lactone oxidase [Dapis sp. BLCC M229]|uniref:D-arabinono-1,4-lactone oxidase n=1 Tax=Dapis sp. BLCC M229 TaxID=3400188 RepID=UPI003CF4849A
MNKKCFINWSGQYQCQPTSVHYPASTEEIRDIVCQAIQRKTKIRVFGSGHSPSDIAMSDRDLICSDRLNQILKIDSDSQTVVAQAGVTIKKLSQNLAKHGLAWPNLGSISDQTIGGAIATATHGTGLNYGILSTIIQEITLVTGLGEILKISLNENSELLNVVRCHIGSLGVVTELKLQVTQEFDLEVREKPETLENVLEKLPESLQADHYRFWYLPHADRVWEWSATRKPPGETALRQNFCQRFQSWYQEKLIGYYTFEFLLYLATYNPGLIASINRWYVQQMFSKSKQSRGNSVSQFNFNCLFKQQVNEWAIPIEHTSEAIFKIRQMIQEKNYQVHLPIEVRFVKGDDIWLSPCQGRDSCYIGVITYMPYGKLVDCQGYFKDYEKIMANLDGRPHWAKRFGPDAEKLEKSYPYWNDFQKVRYRLDPDNLFSNSYSDRVLGKPQKFVFS